MQKTKIRFLIIIALTAVFAMFVVSNINLKKQIKKVNLELETSQKEKNNITNDLKESIKKSNLDNLKSMNDLKKQNKSYEEKIKKIQNQINKIGLPQDF